MNLIMTEFLSMLDLAQALTKHHDAGGVIKIEDAVMLSDGMKHEREMGLLNPKIEKLPAIMILYRSLTGAI